jgi:hypothetical protein
VRDPAYLGVWAEPQVHHHDGDERQHLQHPAPSLSASVGSRGGSPVGLLARRALDSATNIRTHSKSWY